MTDLCELQLERGALVLRGFDDLLAAHAELVPANDAGRRRERDGAHAHLTLLSKHDTRTAAAALARENGDGAPSADASEVLTFARRFVAGATIRGQSILPVGLGRASTSHFVVVLWPLGAALRTRLGLDPADFHVTIGFGAAGDVHDVAKGLSALTRPLRQPLTPAATLVDAAERLLLGGTVSGAGGAASDDDGRGAPDVPGATAVAEAAAVVVADALEADADTGDYVPAAATEGERVRVRERVRAREALERVGVATELHQCEALETQRARRRLGRRAVAFEHLARELHDSLEVARAARELAAHEREACSDDGGGGHSPTLDAHVVASVVDVGLERVRDDDCGCLRDCGGAGDVGCTAPVVVARGAAGAADRAAEQQEFGRVDECRCGRERLAQWPRQRAETFGETVRVARRAEANRYVEVDGRESQPCA